MRAAATRTNEAEHRHEYVETTGTWETTHYECRVCGFLAWKTMVRATCPELIVERKES